MSSARVVRRVAVVAAVALVLASCGGGTASTPTTAGGMVDIGSGLKGPAGVAATVYATGLTHVAALAVDAQQRLWVATADFEDQGQDAVYLVASAGGSPVKIIDGVHTPLGLLWYRDTLYVSSTERVDAYRGFDGSTFATEKKVLTLPAGVGEDNGLVLSPDGRLVLGISAPCDGCRPSSSYSAAVVSFLPDGSDLRVDVSAVRAPIGLAYYPGTSDLFVTMNQRDDLGDATPGDWLSLVRAGQSWGFPGCYGQGGVVCEGAPTPTAVLDVHAAVSGIAIATGQLGAAVGNAAIVAEWATGKVQMVTLTKSGSTYDGEVSAFLTGMKNPVPVLLTSSGALLVGDWTTGKVYSVAAR